MPNVTAHVTAFPPTDSELSLIRMTRAIQHTASPCADTSNKLPLTLLAMKLNS